jgi:TorA maturation chaperone TorD
MVEDHLSALCETMRLMITGSDGASRADVAVQREFFDRHLGSWVFACCGAIRETAIANYYVHVAQLTHNYMALDRDALAME